MLNRTDETKRVFIPKHNYGNMRPVMHILSEHDHANNMSIICLIHRQRQRESVLKDITESPFASRGIHSNVQYVTLNRRKMSKS